MGNCLVTKLKEKVNNDNLIELGTMVFKVDANQSTSAMNWGAFYPATVELTGTAQMYNDAGTQRLDVDGVYTIHSDNMYAKIVGGVSGGKAILKPKYNLSRMIITINPTESIDSIVGWYNGSFSQIHLNNMLGKNVTNAFKEKTGITKFVASSSTYNANIYGDLSDLAASKKTIETINISLSQIKCQLSDIVNWSSLTQFEAGANENVVGDANVFTDSTKLTNLTKLNLVNTLNITNKTSAVKAAIEAAHPGITVIW